MNFRTEIKVYKTFNIKHQDKILMMGSCFVENIGHELIKYKFDVDLNPFGILYNPESISMSVDFALKGKHLTENDIFHHDDLYHSFAFHSSFSQPDKDVFLKNTNTAISRLKNNIHLYDVLFITFGTSYVYINKKDNKPVSNCHKIHPENFERKRLSVQEITDTWTDLISKLKTTNKNLKIVFTVSPIRHWKDGAHENQISKSILLIAINEIINRTDNTFYFPSYELVLDDLRDYRFYEEDMIHPNKIAIKYIWEKFQEMFFCEETLQINKEWEKIYKSITHKPFNKDTQAYQRFLKQSLLTIREFSKKYPYIYCKKEEEAITDILKGKINDLHNF